MSSKAEKEKQKLLQEKCQTILNTLLRDEDNKYCVDCDAKGPRWASWNLGIFLCIRCAGIHRNLGVHISKVKSVNLDSWTPEQVVSLQQMGNSRARAVYEANLPDSFRRPQHDSSLEAFIRAKYEQKKYIAKEWVPPAQPKVNWDREIEESRKKKEGKKKTTTSNITLPTPDLHAIPKPKSPSSTPKPIRAAADTDKKPAASSAAIDLLGLDTPLSSSQNNGGDDIFTSFLSAPAAPEAAVTSNVEDAGQGKRSAEEDSFFNQPAATASDKKLLTKDSIMALYAQGSTAQSPQPPPQVFGMPGGIYTQPSFQVAPQQMAFPTPAMHNGMMGSLNAGAGMPQNGVFAGNAAAMGMASNPFFASGMPGAANFPGAQMAGVQEHALSSSGQDLMLEFAALATPRQNTASSTQQLPQQMARMGLGAQPNMNNMGAGFAAPSSGSGHTLATNLWQ